MGDFNRDNRQDMVVALELSCDDPVLLGNEDATFRSAGAYAVGILSVAVSDFSGDGKLDLAVASRVSTNPPITGYVSSC